LLDLLDTTDEELDSYLNSSSWLSSERIGVSAKSIFYNIQAITTITSFNGAIIKYLHFWSNRPVTLNPITLAIYIESSTE